ncbi:MAG: nucleotidyl transferase [Acidimicrobiaceae bacterium]|nr:nucleotidyl transferase [Acidimicrobiaceae bacterium]
MPTVCILAGGLGSRLGTLTSAVPKPLIELAGRPFLAHQLELLAANGVRRVVCCVGYLGEQIEKALGSRVGGVEVRYAYDGPTQAGTLGAIRSARALLEERFLVLYGDTYLRIDYRAAYRAWLSSGLPGLMTVLRNEGRWDVSNAAFAGNRVLSYDKRSPRADLAYIDYGLGGLDQGALDLVGPDVTDLSDLYQLLAERGLLAGYEANERFYEIGTPTALAETDEFLRGLGR